MKMSIPINIKLEQWNTYLNNINITHISTDIIVHNGGKYTVLIPKNSKSFGPSSIFPSKTNTSHWLSHNFHCDKVAF